MIIVSITGPRMSDALEQIAASDPWADLFEFRFDLIRKPELAVLLLSTRKPVIATCRPVSGISSTAIGTLQELAVFFIKLRLLTGRNRNLAGVRKVQFAAGKGRGLLRREIT